MRRRSFPAVAAALLAFSLSVRAQTPATPPTPAAPVDPASVPDFGEATFDGIPFIKLPAGVYRQGTSDAQKAELKARGEWSAGNEDEMPAREVRIARPFFLSKYEIRQRDWAAMMPKDTKNPSAFNKDPENPVESVTWNDAQAFCKALRTKSGNRAVYRLPTEAEWEYAARAGGEGVYGLGADKSLVTEKTVAEYAWMNGNAENRTHPTGKLKPNAWGLCDLLGNVWEWCEDAYSPQAYKTAPPTAAPFRSPTATERVVRGGCWFLDRRAQRPAVRGANLPTYKSPYVGFRVVREL